MKLIKCIMSLEKDYKPKPPYTMRIYPLTPCIHCQKSFQPRRRNQRYCSTDCRTDNNNETAKHRYTTFKADAPKLATLVAQVRELQTRLTSARILIEDIEEINAHTIRYAGRSYKRQGLAGRSPVVSIKQGVGILTGDTIAYRTKLARILDPIYIYILGE